LHILVAENSFSLEKKQGDIIIFVLAATASSGTGECFYRENSYNCGIQGIFWEGTLKLH